MKSGRDGEAFPAIKLILSGAVILFRRAEVKVVKVVYLKLIFRRRVEQNIIAWYMVYLQFRKCKHRSPPGKAKIGQDA